jgi:hypothetical protein
MKSNTKLLLYIGVVFVIIVDVFYFLILPNVSPDFNLGLSIGISLSCGLFVALLKILSELDYHKIRELLGSVFSKHF